MSVNVDTPSSPSGTAPACRPQQQTVTSYESEQLIDVASKISATNTGHSGPPTTYRPGVSDAEPHGTATDISQTISTSAYDRVRKRFLRQALSLWGWEDSNGQLDEYRTLINADPLGFWTKIWDSFDFTAPQIIDTRLDAESQPLDVKMYLWAVGRDVHDMQNCGMAHQYEINEMLWLDPAPDNNAYQVRVGAEELEEYIKQGYGISIKTNEPEPQIPFPWLDAKLSRFTDKEWAIRRTRHGQWVVHTKEQDDWDEYDRYKDPFEIWCLSEMFVSDVRVPLPRGILSHVESLGKVMRSVYCQEHPVRMIGEAAFLVERMEGNPKTNDDLRAGMLLQMIIRLAKEYRPFLQIAYEGQVREDWSPESMLDVYEGKHKPYRINGKLIGMARNHNTEFPTS